MKRAAFAVLVALAPAANAQPGRELTAEEKAMAAAFRQSDLDTLGQCQARIEGAGVLLRDMEAWLVAQNQTSALQGLRTQTEQGASLIESFSEVRQLTSKARGMTLASSDAARTRMLETFKRLPGEDERAYYTRAQPETRLPQPCRDALKAGRFKIALDGLDLDEDE